MNITLRELSENDGLKELMYLKNLPADENGFCNPASDEDLIDENAFKEWLKSQVLKSRGINLKENRVPSSTYWIMNDEEIVGIAKIRHYLNEILLQQGGHIGISISTNYRGTGLGTKALNLLICKTREEFGEKEVLLTVYVDNIASRRMVEKCGGVLENINEGTCRYWIR